MKRGTALLVVSLVLGCGRGEANTVASAELYEEGLTLLTAGGETNQRQAIERFERALAVDSTYAPAWVGLARAYFDLGPNGSVLSPERTLAPAREAAERAVRLAPDDAAAHVALGNVRASDWDWRGAELAFARALELAPSDAAALNGLASTLFTMSRRAEAIDVLSRALASQPRRSLVLRAQLLDEADTVIAILSERIAAAGENPRPGDFFTLARIYGEEGRWEDGIRELERQIPMMNGDIADETALLGFFHGRLGREAEARRALEVLDRIAADGRYVSPVQRAWVHLGLGEKDEALWLLSRGVASHAHRTGGAMRAFGFIYESVANDSRFVALLARMGMVV